MQIVLLDLEGVLVPEIWMHVAEETGVADLKRTTRDEPDYSVLMAWRLEILRAQGISLRQIQSVIARISPFEGAKDFLDALRREQEVIIVSDTFTQFALPLMEALAFPCLFCNELVVDSQGVLRGFRLRQNDGRGKGAVVSALQSLNYSVLACGDSYNDISMIKCADRACFFRAPASIRAEYPAYSCYNTYEELLQFIRHK